MALIPKPKELGTRPIGCFRSPFRLLTKFRLRCLRKWEEEHASDAAFNASRLTAVADGVWRQSWRCELGAALKLEQAYICGDLLKAYDHVSHSVYARETVATSFFLCVLLGCP